MATITITTAAGTATQTLSTGARGPAGSGGGGGTYIAGTGIDITDSVISATGGGGATELDELSDVLLDAPAAGQALVHDGSKWVNQQLGIGDIGSLSESLSYKAPRESPQFTGNVTLSGEYPTFTSNSNSSLIDLSGTQSVIRTTGDEGVIYTSGDSADISTRGYQSNIYTYGSQSHIYTSQATSHIQSRSTFKLFNGTNTTTIAHSPADDFTITLRPTQDVTLTLSDSGTVAVTNPLSGTQTFSGAHSFSTRPTSSGTGTPAATSLITRTDLETQLMSNDFVYVVDDFFGGGSVGTGATAPGPLPWLVTTLIGTTSFRYGANTALTLPCPGAASIQTGTNNRDCGSVSFNASYAGGGPITQSDFNSSTILKWRFYVQSAMGLRIGLGANPVAPTFQGNRFIGLTGWSPATAWPASTSILLGDYYRPTTPNGRRYYASVAGTTGSTEPVWPTGAASTVVDGGVTWTEDGRDGSANFQYCTRDGTALTGTQTDSGVPYTVGWHTFTLRYLGGNNWGMSVDGALEATLNIAAATITVLMQAQAYTTGQKHLLFDYFKFFQRVR